MTPRKAAAFVINELKPVLDYAKRFKRLCVSFEGFCEHTVDYYRELCRELSISFCLTDISFIDTFRGKGCHCGESFRIRQSTDYAASYVRRAYLEYKPKAFDVFYCQRCRMPTIGYGFFNPYVLIDLSRVNAWRAKLSLREISLIYTQIERHLGGAIAKYFRDNVNWSLSDFKNNFPWED